MGLAESFPARSAPHPDTGSRTAFLVIGTQSVPDGRLLAAVNYAGQNLSPEAAIARARIEAREPNGTGSDFLPVSFRVPVAVCVLRLGPDFALQGLSCLDAPHFRPREIVKTFWLGVASHKAKLVTFNGRGFDMPLLELAAFRYGHSAREYYQNSRNRFNGPIDLTDWLTNFGACRLAGGLDLLAKLLGKPGTTAAAGDRVYELYREGKLPEINDHCLCATLDTYFVFLRTRILTGDLNLDQEADLVARATALLRSRVEEFPVLHRYLDNWTDFGSM
jgi:predicted PolB exonuclease-like 3'-5' exonuclease